MHVSMCERQKSLQFIFNSKRSSISYCASSPFALHASHSSAQREVALAQALPSEGSIPGYEMQGSHGLACAVLARRPPGRTCSSWRSRRDSSRRERIIFSHGTRASTFPALPDALYGKCSVMFLSLWKIQR